MIFLAVLLVIAIVVALFYRSKAKEFESLFELSKDYSNEYMAVYNGTTTETPPKPKAYKISDVPVFGEIAGAKKATKLKGSDISATEAFKPVTKMNLPYFPIKYNKDGSIAKKRGRKPRNG